MNSPPFAEPNFPPNEEYSQSSYFSMGQQEDFYRASTQGYHGGYHDQRRFAGGFSPPPAGPAPPAHGGYGCNTTAEHHQQHHQQQQTPQHGGGNMAHNNSSVQHPVSPRSTCQPPPMSRSPQSVPSPTPANPSMPPACTQSGANSNPPTIYPWMKKVHPNAGKRTNLTVCMFVYRDGYIAVCLSSKCVSACLIHKAYIHHRAEAIIVVIIINHELNRTVVGRVLISSRLLPPSGLWPGNRSMRL